MCEYDDWVRYLVFCVCWETLLLAFRNHPTNLSNINHPTKFRRYKQGKCNNNQRHGNQKLKKHTQKKEEEKNTHTPPALYSVSVVFCFTPHTMDCWSSSLPLDDEFEKLVIRMNPPRYSLNFHSCRCSFDLSFFLLVVLSGTEFHVGGVFFFAPFGALQSHCG